jgi:hypothetical protein
MNSRFLHLVWLGAGTATEPLDLLNIAEQVTLIEARESACRLLQKIQTQSNINIRQQLISADVCSVQFTEYNLNEYSAISPAAGLKKLFPGLKKINSEQLTSTAVTDLISELSLTGSNNSLIVDIPDKNLALLIALQKNGQLNLFRNIQIQTSLEPLYEGAATNANVINFMEETGYMLQQTSSQDPELPWLTFVINPLWVLLQKAQQDLAATLHTKGKINKELEISKQGLLAQEQAKDALNNEVEKLKQDLIAQQLTNSRVKKELEKCQYDLVAQNNATEVLNKELDKARKNMASQQQTEAVLNEQLKKCKQDLIVQQQIQADLNAQLEKCKQDLNEGQQAKSALSKNLEEHQKSEKEKATQLIKTQADLEQASKHSKNRADKITQLEKANRSLHGINEQLQKRQQVLQQELLKAEAQIDIIKELLLKPGKE